MAARRPTVPSLLALLALGLGPGCVDPTPSSLGAPFHLGGIQVNEPDMDAWHERLIATGFNSVSLTVYARQQGWDSAEMAFDPDQLGGDMVREIRAAKRRGLRVVLILRLALEHALEANRFLWHGLVMPRSEGELELWFARYQGFVRAWAEVAEREGVDVLGIGSELSTLTSTRETERLPRLEEYYLNAEKQERERRRVLATGGELDPRHLRGGWDETFDSLPRFLDERSAAHRTWALRVTAGGDLAYVNRRRRDLERRWRRLIAAIRSSYSGTLTYAANFDQYHQVGFWDALDVIGINAYFPLRESLEEAEPSELEATFLESWRSVLDGIDQNRRQWGIPDRPVLFTELGYTRRQGGTLQPWAGDGFGVVGDLDEEGSASAGSSRLPSPQMIVWEEQPLRPHERALAVRSLRRVLEQRSGSPLLMGLLYWKLSTVPSHLEIEPFALILEDREPSDPLWRELRALTEPLSPDRH